MFTQWRKAHFAIIETPAYHRGRLFFCCWFFYFSVVQSTIQQLIIGTLWSLCNLTPKLMWSCTAYANLCEEDLLSHSKMNGRAFAKRLQLSICLQSRHKNFMITVLIASLHPLFIFGIILILIFSVSIIASFSATGLTWHLRHDDQFFPPIHLSWI